MRRLSIYTLLLVLAFVTFMGMAYKLNEGFGYSMGTLIQLQTSHVPSSPEEMRLEEEEYVRQVQQDLIHMTGSGL
jgi:hypothetical protein